MHKLILVKLATFQITNIQNVHTFRMKNSVEKQRKKNQFAAPAELA